VSNGPLFISCREGGGKENLMAGESMQQLIKGVSDNLASASFRATLAQNPAAALAEAGIDASGLPPEVMETLSELSSQEIELLARLDTKLKAVAGDELTGWMFF
jgi:hypothetical protein